MQKRHTTSRKRSTAMMILSANTNASTLTLPYRLTTASKHRKLILQYEKMKVFRAKVLENLVRTAKERDISVEEVYAILQNGQFETTGSGKKKRFFFDQLQTACDVLKAFNEPVENCLELYLFSDCTSVTCRDSMALQRDACIGRIHVSDNNIILSQWS
jgi:hypothetical protein